MRNKYAETSSRIVWTRPLHAVEKTRKRPHGAEQSACDEDGVRGAEAGRHDGAVANAGQRALLLCHAQSASLRVPIALEVALSLELHGDDGGVGNRSGGRSRALTECESWCYELAYCVITRGHVDTAVNYAI